MRFMVWAFIIAVIFVSMIGPVSAQDKAENVPGLTINWHLGRPDLSYSNDLYSALIESDICFEDLIKANADLADQYVKSLSANQVPDKLSSLWLRGTSIQKVGPLYIPDHKPCYQSYPVTVESWVQLEKQINVCVEEFYFKNRPTGAQEATSISVRRDAPPCVNDQGQRLHYHKSFFEPLQTPYYNDDAFTSNPQEVSRYCAGDIARANPEWYFKYGISYQYESYIPNPPLFIPRNARLCRPVEWQSRDLYTLSQAENVCMEVLLDASGLDLMRGEVHDIELEAPVNAPACYDERGQRLNRNDRTVYRSQQTQAETFLDVARRYNVCLQDLWDANPVMQAWDGFSLLLLPDVIFIPDVPPCQEQPVVLTTQTNHSLYSVSLLTNVCINRLIEANPQYPQLESLPYGEAFKQKLTLTIPQRQPCYQLSWRDDQIYLGSVLDYLCYSVPVSPDMDFTGHVPPISASDDASLPYCEQRHKGMTIFYENVPYTLYRTEGWDTMITIGQCFGIDPYELITLNARAIPIGIRPDGWILIPQPHDDCWLTQVDLDTYRKKMYELSYKAGYLQGDLYLVNYQDTLSSIGHRFGYLPQWIAEANGLSAPYTIYYLQELKMPSYPSLYALAPVGVAIGVTVSMSTAIYGFWHWLRRRSRGKKKNA